METRTDRIAHARMIARDLMASRPVQPMHTVVRPTAADLLKRALQPTSTPRDAAWAAAYLRLDDVHVTIDAEPLDAEVLGAVDRRQAWQFQVFPLRRERGVLLLVTTERSLVRAARFAERVCLEPAVLLVTEEGPFTRFLKAYYPFPGVQELIG